MMLAYDQDSVTRAPPSALRVNSNGELFVFLIVDLNAIVSYCTCRLELVDQLVLLLDVVRSGSSAEIPRV